MARKNKKRIERLAMATATQSVETGETRGADALTVAWLITALAASLAELLAGAGLFFLPEPNADTRSAVMVYLVTFIALITATLALVLTPLVIMMRRVPPPRSATAGVITIGLLPWCVVLLFWLRRVLA